MDDNSFFVKNCSLAAIATAEQASSLIELRNKLVTIDPKCIYHHFWGSRMNPQFVHTHFHNDFAGWVHHRLHDHLLSEKLNIIDPTEFENLEELRQEVLDRIESRLDDYETVPWTRKEDRFHFISSTIIIFESSLKFDSPEEFRENIFKLSPSSIFYHFIDARIRTEERIDDFSLWLKNFGEEYAELIEEIEAIDPYFLSLTAIREELAAVLFRHFEKRMSGSKKMR